jgi:hypothetical protein
MDGEPEPRRSSRTLTWWLVGSGAVLFLTGLLSAATLYTTGVLAGLEAVEKAEQPTPRLLESHLHDARSAAAWGLAIALLGAMLLGVALIRLLARRNDASDVHASQSWGSEADPER